MALLQSLLIFNILVALIVLIWHLRKPSQHGKIFHLLISVVLFFALFHHTYVLISKLYFPAGGWVENSAPFGLIYGPLSFLGIMAYKGHPLSSKTILKHCLPYLLFLTIQIAFLTVGLDYRSLTAEIYMKVLYFLISGSLVCYGYLNYHWLKTQGLEVKPGLFFITQYLKVLGALIGLFFFLGHIDFSSYIKFEREVIPGVFIYLSYLSVLIILLNYTIRRKSGDQDPVPLISDEEEEEDIPPGKGGSQEERDVSEYEKSALKEEEFDKYERLLDELMESKEIWLNQDLKLKDVARMMKIPSHYLTQLINVRKNMNFNHFINARRIEHACKLLDVADDDVSFSDISYQCGFNSRATFYRWFRQIKNMTPAEFVADRK